MLSGRGRGSRRGSSVVLPGSAVAVCSLRALRSLGPSTLSTKELSNKKIVVAGAGLAGLAAARDLEQAGASVVVCEARDRVGGRVHTMHEGFVGGQHAEAGADLIEAEQKHVLDLATAVRLEPVRILRRGWGFYGPDARGKRPVHAGPGAWGQAARRLLPEIRDYAFFDPSFDPRLGAWLARPAGGLVFAGEHTSERWQGYMNGTVESGKRAASEVRHLSRMLNA